MARLRSHRDTMSFFEHLEELRGCLIRSILALAAGFLVCLPFRHRLFEFAARPLYRHLEGDTLTFTSLPEPFFVHLKVSFLAGIFLAAPYILYQFWRFLAPGLYPREKRYAVPFVLAASFFFLLGGAFGYEIVFPAACRFFLKQGQFLKQMLTINAYFSLCSKTVLAVAVVFEMPVVTGLLAKLRIVDHRFLLRNAKYAILINFIIAAILTPSQDMVTQTMVAVPMTILYFFSIAVAWIYGPSKAGSEGCGEPQPVEEGQEEDARVEGE